MIINMKGTTAEVLIYEDIGEGWMGGISAKAFANDIKKLGKVNQIDVRINSYGGSVFDGLAMYNTLKNNGAKITVSVDGIAASIASVIAMAADPGELSIAENGFMMIHKPWSAVVGNSEDMRTAANLMDSIEGSLTDTYMKRANITKDAMQQLLADETWLTATEAMNIGLVDNLTQEVKIAAHSSLIKTFKKLPQSLTEEPISKEKLNASRLTNARMEQALRKFKI